jgi:hypothetical protein
MSENNIRKAIESITLKDVEKELGILVKQKQGTIAKLDEFTNKLSERDVEEGIEKYSGFEGFLQAILFFLAFKAALIRKGIKVDVATGAGAAVIFGTCTLCHSVVNATGIVTVDGTAEGIDIVGEMTMDFSNVGFEIAEENIGFFSVPFRQACLFGEVLMYFRRNELNKAFNQEKG